MFSHVDISDDEIRRAFAGVETISFRAKPFNSVMNRFVIFGDIPLRMPLERVLRVIGIKPDVLVSVFGVA